jgi:predicted dehydrogenase/threonine dehydrogenase-like Zn-dependent dehydrogenase
MKQLIVKKGIAINEEVPAPVIQDGFVLIKVAYSCISAGTEMSGVERSKMSLVNRAMEKPEKIKVALDMLKKRGLIDTLKQINDISNTGLPSGYSVSGIVVETGKDITDVKPGDRVAAAGGGYAIHADYVLVPKNLVVKVPEGVSLDEASSATIGAIALHGVHRASLTIGEFCTVIGCGIIGLFTIQILKSSGIKVAAVDLDQRRLDLAMEFGAELIINPSVEDEVITARNWSEGMGVDAVIFTAAVRNSEPLANSFKMCRRKGKVVLVGTAPIEISRQDIYPDEIDFLISTSYGPGRYDKHYEEQGNDYPYAYVRWTENRNIQEFLRLIQNHSVNVKSIIDNVFPIENATEAFGSLANSSAKPLIVLLKYAVPEGLLQQEPIRTLSTAHQAKKVEKGKSINVAVVGTGSFFKNVHLPNLNSLGDKFRIHAVMSHKGYDGKIIAEQNNGSYFTTEYDKVLSDKDVDLVFISTRHKSHAELVLQALKAGKNVFVEKPLAISPEQLQPIIDFYKENNNAPMLMVGFNRRFSAYAQEIKKHIAKRVNPLFIRYRMNAGYLKEDHWVFNEGGRIVGEACHIIDLMQYLTGSPIAEISVTSVTPKTKYFSTNDNKSFTLKFEDGSVASIDYFSSGNSKLSKEFMEVHFDNKSIVLDDYKELKGYGIKIKEIKSSTSEKGLVEELNALYSELTQESSKQINPQELFQTTIATFHIAQ